MLVEGQAASIGELVSEAHRIRDAFKEVSEAREEIWFRGQSSCDWTLIPDLYRPDTARFNYFEHTLLDRFAALATPLLSRLPASGWEWYFLARHHGLPSRLLDWTESLFIAAFFALRDRMPENRLELDALVRSRRDSNFGGCPTIWILDAGSLNLASIGADVVVVPGGPISDPYLPDALNDGATSGNERPIAILPSRANARIAAQHGMFTVHGREKISIDAFAAVNDCIKLGRIRLDNASVPRMINDLRACGIHPLTAFPDLDSVAQHVCWTYQSAI